MANELLIASMLVVGLGLVLQMRNGLRYRPCSFMWGGAFLLLFIVMPLLSSQFYGTPLGVGWNPAHITEPRVYTVYGAMTLTFSLAYLLTSVRWRPRPRVQRSEFRSRRSQSTRMHPQLRLILGLLVIAGVALFLAGTGVRPQDLLREGRFAYFGLGTAQGPLLLVGQYFVGLIAVYAYFDAREGLPNRWLSVLVYGAMLLMMVVAGGRKWLIFAASGWLAGSYDRRGSLKLNARTVTGLALVVIVLTGWQVVRAVGWLDPQFLLSLRDLALQRLPTLLWEGDASYFFRASMEALRLNMSEGLIYPFALLRRVILLPLPAEMTFGLKPGGIPAMFARDLGFYSASRMGNLPPGLFGLFTLSFGWQATLLLGPILTHTGVRLADWLVMKRRSWVRDVVFASFAMVMVLLMRGSEGGLYFLTFNLVSVGAIRKTIILVQAGLGEERKAESVTTAPRIT